MLFVKAEARVGTQSTCNPRLRMPPSANSLCAENTRKNVIPICQVALAFGSLEGCATVSGWMFDFRFAPKIIEAKARSKGEI